MVADASGYFTLRQFKFFAASIVESRPAFAQYY